MIPNHEDDRKKRMLAVLMGKKKELMTPEADSPVDASGEADSVNEEHGGISEEGMSEDGETVCPNCGTHIDSNLASKDGGDGMAEGSPEEEASESPEVEKAEMDHEKKGRLFGHPKKGSMIGLRG